VQRSTTVSAVSLDGVFVFGSCLAQIVKCAFRVLGGATPRHNGVVPFDPR
jgi:hypothetical protein